MTYYEALDVIRDLYRVRETLHHLGIYYTHAMLLTRIPELRDIEAEAERVLHEHNKRQKKS